MTATKSKKYIALSLKEAVAAAATMRRVYKESRCACGCGGTWDRAVSGTIGGESAIWMGCARQGGSSVGGGLTGAEYDTAQSVIRAADRHDVSAQDIIETEIVGAERTWDVPEGMPVIYGGYPVGPLAVELERQSLAAMVAASKDPTNYSVRPADVAKWIEKRQWASRDLDADEITDGILDA